MNSENKIKPNRLKELRRNKKCSYDEVSKETGISVTVLCNLENGKRKLLPYQIKLLSDFYSVSIDYLLGKSESNLRVQGIPEKKIENILNDEFFKDELKNQALSLLKDIDDLDDLENIIEYIKSLS